jgi:hypothetical protein
MATTLCGDRFYEAVVPQYSILVKFVEVESEDQLLQFLQTAD